MTFGIGFVAVLDESSAFFHSSFLETSVFLPWLLMLLSPVKARQILDPWVNSRFASRNFLLLTVYNKFVKSSPVVRNPSCTCHFGTYPSDHPLVFIDFEALRLVAFPQYANELWALAVETITAHLVIFKPVTSTLWHHVLRSSKSSGTKAVGWSGHRRPLYP